MSTRFIMGHPIFGLRREIDRLFDDAFGGGGMSGGGQGARPAALVPAVDVREDENALTLEFEMPGIRPDDVQITAENGVLTVRAEKQDERTRRENERHHIVERSYGTFVRSIQLPQGIDEDKIEADFEHGVLRVRVPKAAQPQPRRIQVRSAGGGGGREVSAGGQTGAGQMGQGSRGGAIGGPGAGQGGSDAMAASADAGQQGGAQGGARGSGQSKAGGATGGSSSRGGMREPDQQR